MKFTLNILLLLSICWVAFSSFDKEKKSTIIIKDNGNAIEMSKPVSDTLTVVNPVTRDETIIVTPNMSIPYKLNGNIIASTRYNDSIYAFIKSQQDSFVSALENSTHINVDIQNLGEGKYFLNLSNIVVDEKGKIVYWNFKGITQNLSYGDTSKISWSVHDTTFDTRPNEVISGKDSFRNVYSLRLMQKKTTDYEEASAENNWEGTVDSLPNRVKQIATMHIKDKELERNINRKIEIFLQSLPKMKVCIFRDKAIAYTFNFERFYWQ